MVNKDFEVYKLKREIKRYGIKCVFKRAKKSAFKEPTNEYENVCELMGIYHEQNGSIQVTTGDTTQTRSKKIPMILCLYDDVKGIKMGDILVLNNKKFEVTGIVNIQEWCMIADISLELKDYVVQD